MQICNALAESELQICELVDIDKRLSEHRVSVRVPNPVANYIDRPKRVLARDPRRIRNCMQIRLIPRRRSGRKRVNAGACQVFRDLPFAHAKVYRVRMHALFLADVVFVKMRSRVIRFDPARNVISRATRAREDGRYRNEMHL